MVGRLDQQMASTFLKRMKTSSPSQPQLYMALSKVELAMCRNSTRGGCLNSQVFLGAIITWTITRNQVGKWITHDSGELEESDSGLILPSSSASEIPSRRLNRKGLCPLGRTNIDSRSQIMGIRSWERWRQSRSIQEPAREGRKHLGISRQSRKISLQKS